MDLQMEDTDTLAGLEERILRAVELVGKLKEENAALKSRLATAEEEARLAQAARQDAEMTAADLKLNASKAERDLEILQTERKQVKARIEKLLGQMDLLSAN